MISRTRFWLAVECLPSVNPRIWLIRFFSLADVYGSIGLYHVLHLHTTTFQFVSRRQIESPCHSCHKPHLGFLNLDSPERLHLSTDGDNAYSEPRKKNSI